MPEINVFFLPQLFTKRSFASSWSAHKCTCWLCLNYLKWLISVENSLNSVPISSNAVSSTCLFFAPAVFWSSLSSIGFIAMTWVNLLILTQSMQLSRLSSYGSLTINLFPSAAFSWFSFFEYWIAATNMGFHATIIIDFPNEDIIVGSNWKSSKTKIKWITACLCAMS